MLARQSDVSDGADDAAESQSSTLGKRITRAREAQGLSLAQAARRLGVMSATLRSWEADQTEPPANRLAMLAGFLGVSPSWILAGVGRGPVNITASKEIESIHSNVLRLKDELVGPRINLQNKNTSIALSCRTYRHRDAYVL